MVQIMHEKMPAFIKLLLVLLFINVFILIFTTFSTNSTPEKCLKKVLNDIETGDISHYKQKDKLMEIKEFFDKAKRSASVKIVYDFSHTDNGYRVYVFFLENYSGNNFINPIKALDDADVIKQNSFILDFKLKRKYILFYEFEDVFMNPQF